MPILLGKAGTHRELSFRRVPARLRPDLRLSADDILRSVTTSYSFRGELWHFPEEAGWHFITLPQDLAEQLREDAAPFRNGDEVEVELTLEDGSDPERR